MLAFLNHSSLSEEPTAPGRVTAIRSMLVGYVFLLYAKFLLLFLRFLTMAVLFNTQ